MFGAVEAARQLGPGKLVVCILADSGDRYLSKCFDDDWMKDMGYIGIQERLGTVRDLLQFKDSHVVFASPEETLASVAHRMSELGISQMPLQPNGGPLMMVHEVDLLQSLVSGECTPTDLVERAAKPLAGRVSTSDPISRVQAIFEDDNVAVVVDHGAVTGVISKIDVVGFLATRS